MAPHGAASKYHQNLEKITLMSLDKGTCPITQSALPGKRAKNAIQVVALRRNQWSLVGGVGRPPITTGSA